MEPFFSSPRCCTAQHTAAPERLLLASLALSHKNDDDNSHDQATKQPQQQQQYLLAVGALQEFSHAVVEHSKVPVVVGHGLLQDGDVLAGHHVQHSIVANGCMLCLALSMHLHTHMHTYAARARSVSMHTEYQSCVLGRGR